MWFLILRLDVEWLGISHNGRRYGDTIELCYYIIIYVLLSKQLTSHTKCQNVAIIPDVKRIEFLLRIALSYINCWKFVATGPSRLEGKHHHIKYASSIIVRFASHCSLHMRGPLTSQGRNLGVQGIRVDPTFCKFLGIGPLYYLQTVKI